ncbi:MAG: DUF5615 family PIN-like protein [Thermus sp.]
MRLLFDENVEAALPRALHRRRPGVDAVRAVEVGLGGRPDEEVLAWAAREGRVVVSRDRATLPLEAMRRLERGERMPGLILLRPGTGIEPVLRDLLLLLEAAEPGELEGGILYLPL